MRSPMSTGFVFVTRSPSVARERIAPVSPAQRSELFFEFVLETLAAFLVGVCFFDDLTGYQRSGGDRSDG